MYIQKNEVCAGTKIRVIEVKMCTLLCGQETHMS